MADDFVNNFGLLGQVLFRKRNDRWAREKLDEALSRELAKIAASAGYDKEIAEMRETGANTRASQGEAGAKERQAMELALREKLAQDAIQANVDSQGRDFLSRLGAIKTEYGAKGDLNEQDWKREEEHRAVLAEIARRKALADGANAAAQYADRFGEIDPALAEGLTGVRPPGAAGPVVVPTRTGRIKLGGGTPSKPGETPRNPDNAAPQVPVQVGPKPLNSGVSIIGGDKATLQGGPDLTQPSFMELMKQSAPYERPQSSPPDSSSVGPAESIGAGMLDSIRGNPWGVGPSSKNMQALLEAYLQSASPAIKK